MGLEDLSDVHTLRHAERVEHDVDRLTIGQERHVFLRHDARNDTLVAVTSGHLVADRDLALLGQIHLHELDHARGQLIRLEDASMRSSAFSSMRAFSSLAASMIVADPLVHLLVLDPERLEVERDDLQLASNSRVSFVPAGIASSTVPHLSASATVCPSSSSASSRHALR